MKWAQAVLREHIVAELNGLLRELGLQAELVVQGLPTAVSVLSVRERMVRGEISFLEANEACST